MGHMPCTNILLTRITSSMLSRDGPGSAEGEGHAYNIEGSYKSGLYYLKHIYWILSPRIPNCVANSATIIIIH